MHRLAAIDIGTVTTRLLIADVSCTSVIPVARKAAITHLGEGLAASGKIQEKAIDRVEAAILDFLSIIERCGEEKPVERVITIATSAARDASNAEQFIQRLAQHGIEPCIIPGAREAQWGFIGTASSFLGKDLLVIDVGGGSTELTMGSMDEQNGMLQASIIASHSFDMGCRRATDCFFNKTLPSGIISAQEIAEARTKIYEVFEPFFANLKQMPSRAIAVAGTATTLVSIYKQMEVYDPLKVHGTQMHINELDLVMDKLAALPLQERRQVCGLQADRACVIVAGMLILREVMRRSGLDVFTVSENDILHGILLDACRNL